MGSYGLDHIRDSQNFRFQQNIFSGQAEGVAGAIYPFMMLHDGQEGAGWKGEWFQHIDAGQGGRLIVAIS